MNDLTITVTGWVATEPRLVVTRDGSGTPMCTFRVAQTARYFDRNTNQWSDGKTEWFSVRMFRDSARLVAESIHKGQPVIIEGRLRTNEWTDAQDVTHWGLQLDATCVGHDLTKGLARFTRTTLTGGEDESAVDGAPVEAPEGDAASDVVADLDAELDEDLEPDDGELEPQAEEERTSALV